VRPKNYFLITASYLLCFSCSLHCQPQFAENCNSNILMELYATINNYLFLIRQTILNETNYGASVDLVFWYDNTQCLQLPSSLLLTQLVYVHCECYIIFMKHQPIVLVRMVLPHQHNNCGEKVKVGCRTTHKHPIFLSVWHYKSFSNNHIGAEDTGGCSWLVMLHPTVLE
jgi:hypothetical protein